MTVSSTLQDPKVAKFVDSLLSSLVGDLHIGPITGGAANTESIEAPNAAANGKTPPFCLVLPRLHGRGG